MVLTHLHLQQNKENALLKRTKSKQHSHAFRFSKAKAAAKSHKAVTSTPNNNTTTTNTTTPTTAGATVTRKPRSRSHIPSPLPLHSSTPSPVLLARKHVTKRKGDVAVVVDGSADMDMAMDVDVQMDSNAFLPSSSSSTSTPSSKPALRLPRVLKKPTTCKSVDMEAIQALDSELANVPLEYVLDKLRVMGRGMLQTACSTTAYPPSDRLPRELQVLVRDTAFPPPTHLFAVYAHDQQQQQNNNNNNNNKSKKVTLHPAHGIVLAAHCAHLPPLPIPTPHPTDADTNDNDNALKLPIIPLSLPSPNTFPLLLAYLYTKNPQALLHALLPPAQPSLTLSNPAAETPTTTQAHTASPTHLAHSLAQTYTTQALLAHAARVHGLWANIVALGVLQDEVVWRIVQFAWSVLVGALEKKGDHTSMATSSS